MNNLVVLRAGPKSLHRKWSNSNRTWKLAISSFHADNAAAFPEADYFHFYRGGKWDGIYAFFCANPSLIDEFDYFWLPDDDINATSTDVERFFHLVRKYELEIAQPSLTNESHFTHAITLKNSFSKIRYTNFVETMVPLLSKDVLKKTLPLFKISRSGFGFDYIWSRMTSDPFCKCAIIDEVSVHHTRPVGSLLARKLKKHGISGPEEMESLAHMVGEDLDSVRPITFVLVTRAGRQLRGRFLCGLAQFMSHMPWRSAGRHPICKSGLRIFGGSLCSHLAHRPNFAKIDSEQIGRWLSK
jgi:Protein of unknown function (DUF707)